MSDKIIFEAVTEFADTPKVLMQVESLSWDTQADMFFAFLLAQGFIVSESDIAKHFYDRAVSMRDLRSNVRVNTR